MTSTNGYLVVVQARLGSRRLPRKVLMPLAGATALERIVERIRGAKLVSEVVVATTVLGEDDAIVALCRQKDIACFRGHPTDCLSRHLGAAHARRSDTCVKIPSDVPLIDPAVIDTVLAAHAERGGDVDFVTNVLPPTWPDQDVEVMWTELLERADREATRDIDREHTTPFFWDPPGRFRVHNVTADVVFGASHRWTLDYPEDYQLLAMIYERLYRPGAPFTISDVLALLAAEPELASLNELHVGDAWYERQASALTKKPSHETTV